MQHNSRLFIEKQLQEEQIFVIAESYALDPLLKDLNSQYPDQALQFPAATESLCGVAIGLALSGKRVLLQLHDCSALSDLSYQLDAAQFGAEFPLSILVRILAAPKDRPTDLSNAHPNLSIWLGGDSLVKQILTSNPNNPIILFELPNSEAQDDELISAVEVLKEGEHLSIYTSVNSHQEALHAHHLLSSEGITADVIVLNQLSGIPSSAQHILSESCKKTGRPIFVDVPQSLIAYLYDGAFWRLESKPMRLSKATSAHIYQAAQEIIL